jgi:hypothetical protein
MIRGAPGLGGYGRAVMETESPTDLSTVCLQCGTPMREEHAHYRCPACGWRDSCCDGPY